MNIQNMLIAYAAIVTLPSVLLIYVGIDIAAKLEAIGENPKVILRRVKIVALFLGTAVAAVIVAAGLE